MRCRRAFLNSSPDKTEETRNHEIADPEDIKLLEDLEELALRQFDKLVEEGSIFFEPSKPETLKHHGFQFEFRVLPYLDKKPIARPDSPSRNGPGGPFANPREEEVVMLLGKSHRMMLNKYGIYRPMFVLPTTEYAPQTDDLDLNDINASWTVLKAFKKTPQMVIYNCGAAAGSSVGHKHLQMFAVPESKSITLFPSLAASETTIASDLPNVLFKHFVLRIPAGAGPTKVLSLYQSLLDETRRALHEVESNDYNVALTSEWIVLIPRRTVNYGGPQGANAAGMLGMITVPNEQERQKWADLCYTEYLVKLGIPIDGKKSFTSTSPNNGVSDKLD